MYADCEGCLLDFCKSEIGKYILNSVRYIINEMDGFAIHKDLDNELRKIWCNYNFKKIATGYGCGISCDTEIWEKL